MTATNPYIPRIGVLMDFDRTLASDTIDALCAEWDISREEWEERYNEPLGKGWDDILKRSWALIQCGRDRGRPLSLDFFEAAAGHLDIYRDAADLPERLKRAARDVHDDVEVETIILSSGYAEMIKHTSVAKTFDRLWAGTFYFRGDGEAIAAKRIISHGQKARYLEAYAKGLDLDAANEPETDSTDLSPDDMHVPLDQMIYVGDGLSDLKAFRFVTGSGGLAIAVDEDHSFAHEDSQTAQQRVENLAPPDYDEGGEMLESLKLAVTSAAARVAIRARGRGE